MYKKFTEEGYIIAVGTGIEGEEIPESEYESIISVFATMPTAYGKAYKLKDDLTWEEYDLPVPSDEDEISDAEAYSIIMGEI